MRDPKYPGTFWTTWGAALTTQRSEITMATTDKFVTKMFGANPDFVFTVTRDFVRGCQNPVLSCQMMPPRILKAHRPA
jgi:hypothetical protein